MTDFDIAKRDRLIIFLLKTLDDIGRPDYVIKRDWAHTYNIIRERTEKARHAIQHARKKGFDHHVMQFKRETYTEVK